MFSPGLYKAERPAERRLIEAALERNGSVDLQHRHAKPILRHQIRRSVDVDDLGRRRMPLEHVFRLLTEMASAARIQHDPHG